MASHKRDYRFSRHIVSDNGRSAFFYDFLFLFIMFPLHSLDGFFSSSFWGWGWGDEWGGGGGGGGGDKTGGFQLIV